MTRDTFVEKQVLEWMPQPVLLVDDRSVLFANSALTRLLGSELSVLRRRPLSDYLPLVLLGTSGSGTAGGHAEHSIVHADGSERRVELSVSSWPPNGTSDCRMIVLHDITEQRGGKDKLLRGRDRIRELGARRELLERRHRWRLAKKLHDTVQQQLAAMLFELDALFASPTSPRDMTEVALERIRALAADALRNTIEMIDDLQPLIVDELNIEDSLRAACGRFSARTGISCSLEIPHHVNALDDSPLEWRLLAHECLRDVLAEVQGYSGVERIHVALSPSTDGGLAIRLKVDTARSLQSCMDRSTPELWSLRERLKAVGGQLRLVASDEDRTSILMTMPPARGGPPATPAEEHALPEHSYETLLRFFYQVPVGLLLLAGDGTILMLNPDAARALLPLAKSGDLTNLFALTRRGNDRSFDPTTAGPLESGESISPLSIPVPTDSANATRSLELTLKRLSDGGFAAVLGRPAMK